MTVKGPSPSPGTSIGGARAGARSHRPHDRGRSPRRSSTTSVCLLGKRPPHRDTPRLVHGAGVYHSRPPAGPLPDDGRSTRRAGRIAEDRRVSLRGVSDRPASRQQPGEPGLWDAVEKAVASVGQDLADLIEQEEEPGLGNGGLGRLAACYMDSLATLDVPAIGYGIRYEFGIFDQAIRDGWQVELTDKWLRFGNPWEIVRPEMHVRREVRRPHRGIHRRARRQLPRALAPERLVKGVAYDTPVPGYRRADRRTSLRLWKAEARRVVRLRRVQRRRLLRRGGRRRSRPRRSRRCSIRTTSRRPASGCGWRSSTSSSRARCRT